MKHTRIHEPSTLLHLLSQRAKMLGLDAAEFPPYRKPEVTLGKIEKAATAMAEWDNSDPFAYGRTALHVKQGYLDPNEVIKEVTQRTAARRVARAREVDNDRNAA